MSEPVTLPLWVFLLVYWLSLACNTWLSFRAGYKRGNALCPNDYVLRDVARQRDQMMRERDVAQQAADQYAMALEFLRRVHHRNESRPN